MAILHRSITQCNMCNKFFKNDPFMNMDATGESTLAILKLYGDEYIFCSKCTNEIRNFIFKNK